MLLFPISSVHDKTGVFIEKKGGVCRCSYVVVNDFNNPSLGAYTSVTPPLEQKCVQRSSEPHQAKVPQIISYSNSLLPHKSLLLNCVVFASGVGEEMRRLARTNRYQSRLTARNPYFFKSKMTPLFFRRSSGFLNKNINVLCDVCLRDHHLLF